MLCLSIIFEYLIKKPNWPKYVGYKISNAKAHCESYYLFKFFKKLKYTEKISYTKISIILNYKVEPRQRLL